MFPDDIQTLAAAVIAAATTRGWTVATAESCTGGLVAGALTAVAGSSAVVNRGFVTYSNAAKTELLGVPAALIEAEGAVSEPVAKAMADGARSRAGVTLAVSITGIAGPGGGSPDKPVGRVHFACAAPSGLVHEVRSFGDIGREAVRLDSVRVALNMLRAACEAG
ncbi:MAG: nicotinamide-nucleotide amidohydrolase family protein [Alphaproteobacteria bacterium]|nr:nicotinamide-nucleotide amidohydrolase family protein [Alphaproteobacteria bacterium]MBU2379615.1 nicotinamide-nucleotide amidohydrolase family protein [Alphaproteobacteria bacterium]